MNIPRNEHCRICELKGRFFESDGIDYVDCQRDNEDIKNRYLSNPNKEDGDSWIIQQIKLGNCIYRET